MSISNTVYSTLRNFLTMQPQLQIPRYQRQYQWGRPQISRLIHDCFAGIENNLHESFFGTVIIHSENGQSFVVDGQQRLSTIMLILAVLRDSELVAEDVKNEIGSLLETEAQPINDLPVRPRILPGRGDRQVFIDRIWPRNATKTFTQDDKNASNYPMAISIIHNLLQNTDGKQVMRFLLDHCYVVRLETSSEDLAFKIFETVNDTGLKISSFDILRYKFAKHAANEEGDLIDQLLECWDVNEAEFGSINFQNYIKAKRRALLQGRQPNRAINLDFIAAFPDPESARHFILQDLRAGLETLTNTGDRIEKLTSSDHQLASIRTSLELADIPNSEFEKDWFPIFEIFLELAGEQRVNALKLLEARQWFAYFEVYNRGYLQKRSRLYASVLTSIHNDDLGKAFEQLKLSQEEKATIRTILSGHIHEKEMWLRSFLTRIELKLHDENVNAAPPRQQVSVEHVLPLRPHARSNWFKDFGGIYKSISESAHRLGNLAAVTQELNGEMDRSRFEIKQSLTRRQLPENYKTADDIRTEKNWTKELIERRTAWLIKVFCDALNLHAPNYRG